MTIRTPMLRSEPLERDEPASSIERELVSRGIEESFAREASQRLAPFAEELPTEQYDAVLSGVVLAFGVHRAAVEAFGKTTRDLEEVQRLLGSFGGELQKLDEALELLSAYAARLRVQTKPSGDHTLH
jgi:hypothetical protein